MDYGAELELRQMIFDHLAELLAEQGSLNRAELTALSVNGETRRLIDQNRGIWNPRDLQATLSIVSKPDSQYSDEEVGESLFAYSYREGSTNGDNTKLRRACELELPIILLRWIRPSIYVPVFPVYVVADDTENRRFILALDESLRFVSDPLKLQPLERKYAQRAMRQRLHQPEFRGRILLAYGRRCAVCELRHPPLLDAAHILADTHEKGVPEVDNGLCLCKIHHAAYDTQLLGISPDYEVVVGEKMMQDPDDGPMLRYGFREMNGRRLSLPNRRKDRPSRDRLAERFAEFKAAG
ncbi:HNH endonuclease [Nocardia sp. R7R-8]|uniref:HNH endonuclease n=1 Tax=Nocardia sp. R7R-8 TaxID=3459304 RepID=UPI00403DBAF7